MKILFVQPKPAFLAPGLPEPLAYETLAATVPHHDVKIFDMRLDKTPLSSEIEACKPDVVGVGCATAVYHETAEILKQTKRVNPEIITIAGGHHASARPRDFSGGLADYVVLGEGESTFPELMDYLESGKDIREVRGLGIPSNGTITFTDKRPLIDLDQMPFPNRRLTREYRSKYCRGSWSSYAGMVASRGCSFRCTFCCQWRYYDGAYRVRSPEKIVEELSQIEETFVDFFDDNSWEDVHWMEDLYQRIKEARIKKHYKLYARSDLVTARPDIVEKWKSIGLRAVLIGFESFRDEDLKIINKKSSVNKNREAAEIMKANGVDVIGYFLVHPSYTREDFLELRDHVRKLDIMQPIFLMLTPLPGSRLYEELKDTLLTQDPKYFDGMHALTPTALPPDEFYKLYRDLYRKAYTGRRILKNLFTGKMRFSIPQMIQQTRFLRELGPVEE